MGWTVCGPGRLRSNALGPVAHPNALSDYFRGSSRRC